MPRKDEQKPLLDGGLEKKKKALEKVIKKGDSSQVAKILESVSEVGQKEKLANSTINDQNVTLLHLAAFMRQPNCMQKLIDAGANVDATDKSGSTPLHYVVRSERFSDRLSDGLRKLTKINLRPVFRTLSALVPVIGVPTEAAVRAADSRSHHQKEECIKILFVQKANFQKMDNANHAPLWYAKDSEHYKTMRLLSNLIDLAQKRNAGTEAPLREAASQGKDVSNRLRELDNELTKFKRLQKQEKQPANLNRTASPVQISETRRSQSGRSQRGMLL